MQRAMWMGTAAQAQRAMRLCVWLTLAYGLAIAILFYPGRGPDFSSEIYVILFAEACFAGPMIIAIVLSVLVRQTRRIMVVFQVGYILLTMAIYSWTLTGEHDAQYQLALLFIPLIGYPAVVVAGLVAALHR